MRLADMPTPSLVLDRPTLIRNLDRMAAAAARHGVALRPHMKTAKSIDVARLALARNARGVTVSTLAEASYFAGHGLRDILYAVGVTPQKLAALAALDADVLVITDDAQTAAAIANPLRALIEIDTGEGRGGVSPTDPALLAIAAALGDRLAGVMTHAGHSYAGRSAADMAAIAETERSGIVTAAQRLREAGFAVPIVSMGSTPTALYAARLDGVSELRAGVYMFGDLFQMQIGSHGLADIAVTVLASVVGRRPAQHRLLLDSGGLALSKDRSTATAKLDYGFGLMLDVAGQPRYGHAIIQSAYQEHGVVACDTTLPFPDLPVGAQVRVAPNHTCMTAAAHDHYAVVDGDDAVVTRWGRVNGW